MSIEGTLVVVVLGIQVLKVDVRQVSVNPKEIVREVKEDSEVAITESTSVKKIDKFPYIRRRWYTES